MERLPARGNGRSGDLTMYPGSNYRTQRAILREGLGRRADDHSIHVERIEKQSRFDSVERYGAWLEINLERARSNSIFFGHV